MASDDWYFEFVDHVEKALKERRNRRLYDLWHEDYFKKFFYEDLKIIGGAFTVLESVSNRPLLLFSKEHNPSEEVKDPECDFFWFPYQAKHFASDDATIIDKLFLTTRESQRLNENAPDFLRFLHSDEKDPPFERYPFNFFINTEIPFNSRIIYCDHAELLIFLLSYLELVRRVKKRNSTDIIYSSRNSSEAISVILDESIHDNRIERVLEEYSGLDGEILNQNLYRALGLATSSRHPTSAFEMLRNRLANIAEVYPLAITLENEERNGLRPQSLDEIPTAIDVLLKKVFVISNYSSYEMSLRKLHGAARFPIIPYLEIFLKKKHNKDSRMAHLVLPVWESFTFAPRVRGRKKLYDETNVVLALLTVNDEHYAGDKENLRRLTRAIRRLGQVTADTIFYEKFAIKNIRSQATKAAISQVMARNMSHNIGSHVLTKFKDASDIHSNRSKTKYWEESQYVGENYNALHKHSDLENENQIAYFNQYMKHRMDFLADIATQDPSMENAMLLRKDIIKGFDRNRILLNRISGISDPALKFRIVLRHRGEEIGDGDDVSLSITNEILGAHAFYILLENVIRNVAKHSKAEGAEKSNIEITLDVNEFGENKLFYEISIYDNLGRTEDDIRKIVKGRNRAFDQKILHPLYHRLRENNLGTIEMEVCAAYLRGLPITSVEEPVYRVLNDMAELAPAIPERPKLLYAYAHPLNREVNEYSLGYKLCISKPKEVLVIDDDDSFTIGNHTRDELAGHGITAIKQHEMTNETVFGHQLLYCHTPVSDSLLNEFNAQLPRRVVKKISGGTFSNPKEFIRSAWESYAVKKYLQGTTVVRFIWEEFKVAITGANGRFELLADSDADAKTVLIDNHNPRWCRNTCKGMNPECECTRPDYDGPDYSYYDMGCSHSRILRLAPYVTSNNLMHFEDVVRKAEYLEVVFCKIVLIDERIQENVVLSGKSYPGVGVDTNFYQYFLKQNLIIPSRQEVDLNQLSFGSFEQEESIASKMRKFISDKAKDFAPDFFVVHLGILEKMMDSNTVKDQSAIQHILTTLFPGKERMKIVITSGRGKPNNLPSDVSFVPLALIQNAVETVFDKFQLTKILYNSRRAI